MKNRLRLIILFTLSQVVLPVQGQNINSGYLAAQVMMANVGLSTSSHVDQPVDQQVDQAVVEQQSSVDEYDLVRVKLEHSQLGTTRLLLKGPRGFFHNQDQSLRAMMIVSGFFTGDQSIMLLGSIPKTVLVGFEYPFQVEDFQNNPSTILQFVRLTPGQIALALHWLASQTWINPDRLSVMGVSLGGVFLPSAVNICQLMGVTFEKIIFVGTGADVNSILKFNLNQYFSKNQSALDFVVGLMQAPMLLADPVLHLPLLKGSFLIVQSDQDTVIPRESQKMLFDHLQNPKSEMIIPGPHINSDQTEMIQKIQQIVLQSFE
ncbi:MAG: hypothetical protein ACK5P5_04130 [Pseudobdellovibrionaceae bacterium]